MALVVSIAVVIAAATLVACLVVAIVLTRQSKSSCPLIHTPSTLHSRGCNRPRQHQELNPTPPIGQQGPKYLGHHQRVPQPALAGRWEHGQSSNSGTTTPDVGIPLSPEAS